MTTKLDNISVQVPKETAEAIQRIAKLAGVKQETIMKIAIAMECARWERVQRSQP